MSQPGPQQVLHFWFNQATPEQWFSKDTNFDQLIRHRFISLTKAAAQAECFSWRTTIYGRVAEIIVLDQFSRNIWRDKPQSFQQDAMALALAQELVKNALFAALPLAYRKFALMPYMHSESALIHQKALPLFETYTDALTVEYELKHKSIIDRFGRYPHRNHILGRQSTIDELTFLNEPNSSF